MDNTGVIDKILDVIFKNRTERGWTEYQLAERSELPQSTISSWFCRKTNPTIYSLEKICQAFGITLAQLFAETGSPVTLTDSQMELIDRWAKLDERQQEAIFHLMDVM